MKQYLSPEQTVKLIELGFEKPRYYSADKYTIIHTGFDIINYSIGELIEILGYDLYSMHYLGMSWEVKGEQVAVINEELIDALYAMILQLKEEGII